MIEPMNGNSLLYILMCIAVIILIVWLMTGLFA